jgi:NADH-quinone oxidoreductase subunit A
MQSDQLSYVPILQFLLAAGFVVGTIIVSGKLGPKRKSEIKNKNFECGVEG